MKSINRIISLGLGLVLSIVLCGPTLEAADYQVGRVSHLDGKIFFQSGRALDWLEGYLNSPVQEGDRIWTDIRTYAEIQLDGSILVRLDGDTKLDISAIGSRWGTVCKLWLGSVFVRVVKDVYRENPITLETPDGSIEFMTKGLYRIDVEQDNTTFVRLYEGVAEIKLRSTSLSLRQGESIRLGNGEQVTGVSTFSRSTGDDFTRYNDGRDELLLAPESAGYIDPSLAVGVYDLDYYGIWVYDPSYGYCWRPRTFVGWVPYRFGHWTWIFPWGWTWISLEPWGWLPYHYGFWYYSHYHGWMWRPGNQYGPAWVAWTAHGNSIGWVPLHPDDPPYYHWNAQDNTPNYYYHGKNVAKPLNASLHIGVNASTHLSTEDFSSGKIIEKNTDLFSVNRSDITGWDKAVPEEIKPVRQSSQRIPSTDLREKSRANTWTDSRTVSGEDRPMRQDNNSFGSGSRSNSNSDRSPAREDNGRNPTGRSSVDRDSGRSTPDNTRPSQPERSTPAVQERSSAGSQNNRSTPTSDRSTYSGSNNNSSNSRSDFSNSGRSESEVPSYRRPYESSSSQSTNRDDTRTRSSSDRGTYSRSDNDQSSTYSPQSRYSEQSTSGSRSSDSSGRSSNKGSSSKGNSSSGSSSKSENSSSKSSSKSSGSSSSSNDSSSSSSTKSSSSKGFHH